MPEDAASLAAGIAGLGAGDTLLVGPGRYLGTLRIPDGVVMIGVDGAAATILDGDGKGPVVTFDEVGIGTLLDGFTITGGVRDERRGDGAGILCRQHASPRINNNIIHGNRALGEDGRGGGVACVDGATAVLANNRIFGNEAAWGGGIFIGKRGGWEASPIVSSNRIERNRARAGGGGLAITGGCEPVVSGNVVAGNVSLSQGGGGFHIARGAPVIEENVIWANADSAGRAAAICLVDYAAPQVERNIIAGHHQAPAIRCVTQSIERQVIACNVLWNPEAVDFAPGCAIYPGNIIADPLLCAPAEGRFGLRPSSPCLEQRECGVIGAFGIGCQDAGGP